MDTLCGGPCKGTQIRVGDPVQTVQLSGLSRILVRCRHCADSDVPPDLPAVIVNRAEPIVPTMPVRFGTESLPLDFKHFAAKAGPSPKRAALVAVPDYKSAAAGREPGSDDE